MKLDLNISFLINSDQSTIEIQDEKSRITFLKIQLSPKKLSEVLSGISYVPVVGKVGDLKNVGKEVETQIFTFEITREEYYARNRLYLQEKAQKLLDEKGEGWKVDEYFESKDSFYISSSISENVKYTAKVNIYRYI